MAARSVTARMYFARWPREIPELSSGPDICRGDTASHSAAYRESATACLDHPVVRLRVSMRERKLCLAT